MLKSYKYRIYPNKQQVAQIDKTISYCRLIYNLALQTKIDCYKANGTKLSVFNLCRQLTEMKDYYKWLNDVDSQALKYSIHIMDRSFKNFFCGRGYPKFKSKRGTQSFQCPNNCRRVDFDKATLTIPKIKEIPIRLSRKFDGEIKTVTISRTKTNKYFASILIDDGKLLTQKKNIFQDTAVGIDVGIKHFAVLSDGIKIENPKHLRNNLMRLKCLQRRLSRKIKGSKNRNKARIKVSLQYEKITNQRNDFLHKLSTAITKQYDTVCVENLQIRNMIKNRSLALSISDAGWGEFYRQLKYKQEWNGGNYLELPRFQPSTKLCNGCGAPNKLLTLADREWTCASCGVIHDRDINAAVNIRNYFFMSSVDSREELAEFPAIVGTMKQEVALSNNIESVITDYFL